MPEDAHFLPHPTLGERDAPLRKPSLMLLIRLVRQAVQVIHHRSQERQHRLLDARIIRSDPKDVAVILLFKGHSGCGGTAFVVIAQVGEVVQQLATRLLLISRSLGDGGVLAPGLAQGPEQY